MAEPRVCIFAGGTGGHVFPALAVAERLREDGWSVSWIGTRRGLEARVAASAGLPLHFISARQFRGARRLGALAAAAALVQALGLLLRLRPVLVIGMGGFVSAPGGAAAWLLRRPLLIHEQNAIPGLANRLLARVASGVMESFPGTFSPRRRARIDTTGNPVRSAISSLPPPAERFVREERGEALRVLVLGGSQGAESLNRSVPAAAAMIEGQLAIRHQAGAGRAETTLARYREAGVEAVVTAFVDDVADAYGWADLVLCRAGASTVAELAAAGVGAILVPYPWAADDHQSANARFLAERGAAHVVPDGGDVASGIASWLGVLASDRSRCLAMAEAARRLGRRDAVERVAACCRALRRRPVRPRRPRP